MYDAVTDPYCYPGSAVLENLPGLTSQGALARFEAVATGRRFVEPMPSGRWSVRHYRAVHRHIFQDVYAWAGRTRTTRISKGGSMFCYPEHIDYELRRTFRDLKDNCHLRRLGDEQFATKAAHLIADLNAIHAFRDGNGRTQLAFLILLAAQAGHPIDSAKLDPASMLHAMIAGFRGDERPLAEEIALMIG